MRLVYFAPEKRAVITLKEMDGVKSTTYKILNIHASYIRGVQEGFYSILKDADREKCNLMVDTEHMDSKQIIEFFKNNDFKVINSGNPHVLMRKPQNMAILSRKPYGKEFLKKNRSTDSYEVVLERNADAVATINAYGDRLGISEIASDK
tara:strand:- start:152 stop:601 length:450 start_codon:yes stop_codon:yes gene_type:complete